MTPDLVSTIIASYNRPHLLREAVASVLAQTHRPIEIVIVDDGSTDDTPAVARELAAANPDVVRVFEQPHVYYTAAWNRGLREIRGEFVQILDSDDLLLPEKFSRQVEALRRHPERGIAYSYIHEHPIDAPRTGQPARHTASAFDAMFPQLLSGKIWPSPSPLYRRTVTDALGDFLDVRVQPDWEWDCRAAAIGVRLVHCPEFLGETRGTHAREGRSKGGVPAGRSADYLLVLTRVLAHARAAAVDPLALSVLAPKFFAASRYCKADGRDEDAATALQIAKQLTPSGQRVWSAVARAGSLPLRAVRYGYHRARDYAAYRRGRNVLRKYSDHYTRGRRAFGANGIAASFFPDGVALVRPGTGGGIVSLPAGYDRLVSTVAGSAAKALDHSGQCRFVPAIQSTTLPERTSDIPEVTRGAVITAQLRDPLGLDGLPELCDPLIEEIERRIYGSHVLVDKVYVYRSLISSEAPRASWLWHYDNHPREMLKVMVYLTDVTEGTAPFEYLCHPNGRPVLGAPLAPLFGGSRVTAETIERHRSAGAQPVAITGPRGTVIVFDDNIVHRATVASTGVRDVVVFQIRPATFRPSPRIDPRWTGSFLHRDINVDPDDLTPHVKA